MGPGQGRQGRRCRAADPAPVTSSATSSRPAGWSGSPPRRSCPATAPRILAQLGYAYPYGADGNGGPALLDELRWGAHARRGGSSRGTPSRSSRGSRSRPTEPAEPPASGPSTRRARRPEPRPRRVDPRCASSTRTATSRPTASRATSSSSSAAPGWPASSGSSCRAGTGARPRRRVELVDRHPWLDAAVGIHPHVAAEVDDAGWARIVEAWPPIRGSSRSARPGSTRTGTSRRSTPSSRTCAATWTWPWRPASRPSSIADPRAGRARCPGLARPGAARRPDSTIRPLVAALRRPSAGRHPLVLRTGGLRRDRDRHGPRGLVQRPRLPGGGGAERRGRRGSSRPTASSSRPTRRTSRRRAPRAGGTSPNGSGSPRSGSASGAARRPRTLGIGLVAAYDRVFVRPGPDRFRHRRSVQVGRDAAVRDPRRVGVDLRPRPSTAAGAGAADPIPSIDPAGCGTGGPVRPTATVPIDRPRRSRPRFEGVGPSGAAAQPSGLDRRGRSARRSAGRLHADWTTTAP